MSTAADSPLTASETSHRGLEDLLNYPLMACLQDRRTRRIAQGTSITGGLDHQSTNPPSPLTPLEEAVLIASIGVTGSVMHDGPLTKPNGAPELGTPFLQITGRAASSADNCQATSMFMINDEGVWLLRRLQGREALELAREIPPRFEDRTEADWIAAADVVKRKVYDSRFSFPREWPYYLGWNAQMSNVPGSTSFLPVVDNTRQYINALLILCGEPRGRAPLFLDDFSPFRPKGAMEWAAWAAMKAGVIEPIPYQPIGGLKRLRRGYVTKDVPAPLNMIGEARTDHEAFLLLQNLMLVGEALRLGGWVHSAPMPPYLTQRDPDKGIYGLGFREHPAREPRRWRRWPPVPGSQPNLVGIDGVLEGLCPPYVTDMDAAVDQVLEEKLGAQGGAYGDAEVFGQVYRDRKQSETFRTQAKPFPPEAVEYTKEICRYLVDTYGRFPAHTNAFHVPGIWVQFSHLELDFYERYANPGHFRRQAEGREIWGRTTQAATNGTGE